MRLGVLARAQKPSGAPTPTGRIRATRGIAVVTAALLGAGGSVLAAAPATAAPAASVGQGRFLSGSALGLDLDDILTVTPADARNTGGETVTDVHPLDVTALNAVNVNVGNGLNLLGENGILTLGAVNQYAAANADGSSTAASGAVTNTGGIGVGGQDGVPQANASFALSGLIGEDLSGALADLDLEVGAVSATAAQAAGPDGAQTGDYGIEDLDLTLTSPALSDTVTDLRGTLAGLQPTVDNLTNLLQALGGLGGVVQVSGIPNLVTVLDSATNVTSADGSITANLQTGAITIDVPAVLATAGLDLNDLPPNTDLTPYITNALTTQLLPAITTALQGVVTQLTNSLQNLTVTLAGIPLPAGQVLPIVNPVLAQVVAPINAVISGLGTTVITPLADALTDVVSLQGNVQETAGGVFTQRALRVGLLPTAATPAAVVNLASAAVGPNAGPLAVPTLTALAPDNGPTAGGTTVTVTGTDFTDDSTVSVDGSDPITPASVSDDGTELTFVTPPHAAGAVDVTVTTPSGTSDPLTFTYNAAPVDAPTATALDPDNGPVGGGTTVTVTGTDFTDDATVSVDGSDPITPDSVAEDGTSLTFTTPAHAAGAVDVTVTTAGGTTDPLTFTYNAAPAGAPTLDALDPDNGPAAGGTSVTITGDGFTDDSTVSVDGSDPITPAAVSEDGTELTFTTPAHAAGPVPVTVTNGDGTSEPLTYTYNAAAPTVTDIDPAAGPTTGGTSVTLTGTDFTDDATVSVDGSDPITPDSVSEDGTELTFTTPAHAAGAVDVTVTTGAGTSDPVTFTYEEPTAGVPTLDALDPDNGPAAGGTTVTVTGTGFTDDATVSVDGSDPITPDSVSEDGTELTFTTPAHTAGAVDVTVTTAAGTSEPLTFTYNAAPAGAPTLDALDPDNGPTAGGTSVTITGDGFTDDSTVSVDNGAAITPDEVSEDGTSLTFTTPAHAAGAVPVTVTNGDGTSEPLTFTYNAAAPTITDIDPANGPAGGGTTVTLSGTGFTDDATVSVDGSDPITPDSVSEDGTELTFTTPAHAAGEVDVTVTTDAGTSDPVTFVYDPAPANAPTLDALDPEQGPAAGGTTVTVTGTGFTEDSTVSVDNGEAITPTSVSDDGTELTFTTPAHAAGEVPVTVTNGDGTSEPLTFTYLAAAAVPTATALDPDNGPAAGGTSVTITGTGFTDDATVSVDGVEVTPDSVAEDGTSLTFTTPAHAAGAVDVTVTTAGGTTDPLTFTYAAAPAGAPTLTALDPDHGPAAGGTSVTITGTGFTDDSTVSVDGSDPITPDSVSEDGTELTFTTPAHDPGEVTVTVTNADGPSEPLAYTYDAVTAPEPPVITSPEEGGTVTTGTPPITGTGEPGATATVRDGDTVVCTTTVAADGTWTCTPLVPFGPGTHTITATQTGAGGESDPSDAVTFTVVLVGAAGSGGTGGTGGTGAGGALAYTGADTAPMIAIAVLLLLAGAGLTIVRRHRRS